MNRGRLKRRISPCTSFGKEDDCRGNVEQKRFRHLTGIQSTDHEVTKDKAYLLAADEYERYLTEEDSVATGLAPYVKSDTAAVANLLTCGSPLQSDRKLRHLGDINSSLQLPETREQDVTNTVLNGTRQLSQHDLDLGVSELPGIPFVTEQQRTYDECAVDGFCQICKKDISCCNEQQRLQHTNHCIDELEHTEQEKKRLEEAAENLWIQQVLNCPICLKKLKTQNARHLHLKKCAARFCISPMDLIELIKKQEQDHQIQLLSNSLQETSDELATTKRKPAVAKEKKKRAVKNRFEEPHSKLEEDTQLAIALSTSIEDRRKSLADFVSYTLPVVNKPEEKVIESHPLIDATLNPLPHSSKDAFLLLMSQKTKESSLSTGLGKKNKVAKQPSALLALDQDEVKRRLAEKATALVLEQPDISAFYDVDMPCFPRSKLSAKYCHKRSKDFLWCLATQNMEKLCNYYVKELVHPIVPSNAAHSSLQQKHLNWQMSDEKPELSLLDPAVTSVLYGSTQTALVLAELAAEAGTETSFADDFSQKSLCSCQEMLKQPSPSAAVAKGFYSATDEVCEKTSSDLLNAWSQMVDNGCMSDLTVDCRDGEIIRLHRLVIMARYPNLLQMVESESSTKVFSQFSKMAALSVVRFIYSADTDVSHAVVFEAKRLAESLQFTDFCKICENVIKTYDLIEELTEPEEASAATVEEQLVMCSWSHELDPMQRDNLDDSCGDSGKAVEKEEEEEEEDADLDEVYAFMLTQRRNQMNRGGITEDKDNESDTSKKSIEDKDDPVMMTRSQSYSGSDNEGDEDVLLLELSHAASFGEKLSAVISSGKSHEVMRGHHASCDSALTSEECASFGAKTFPEEILSQKKECSSSVHVESSGGEVQQRLDSFLIDSLSKNSYRAIDLVAMEDEADRCLSVDDYDDDDDDDDDDEKDVLPEKSGEEFASVYTAPAKLYNGKDESRETSCLVDGSCVSSDILMTDPEHPLDSTDVCAVGSFDTNQHGEKEPVVSYTLILPLKSASSSSCSSTQGFLPSSGSAFGSIDAIYKHANGLVSTCIVSSDSLSPDLFPSSPCSESLVSSVVSVQEPCVLLQAAKKLKNVLDTDEVFREMLETSESMIDYRRNLSTGNSARGIERQSEAKCEKYGHTEPTLKIFPDSSIYLEKGVADENFLPDLDDDDDGKVQNPTEATCGQSLPSAFLNCSENSMKSNHMTSNNNEIEDSMCSDEVLFRHGMRTLNFSPDVEIGMRTSKMNESFRNRLVSSSKSSSSCRMNSTVVTDKVENGCQMLNDKTSEEIQNVEMSDEAYSEKKRHISCDDVADCAANDDDDDDDYDGKNATPHISIQCDDEVSAAVLDSDGRICDEENIWENFPEQEFMPHVSFENERNASHVHMLLASVTPKSVKMQGLSAPGKLTYSPPTDMETDVSALMEDVIANSSLLNSDVSFETSDGPARTVIDAKSPVVNMVKQVNCSEFAGTPVTPLPSYGQMNTPALKQRCHDYGIRRLPKKQMVGVLENIFFELHPGIPKPDMVKPKQNANKKTKAVTKKGNLASFLTNKRPDGNVPPQQDNRNIRMTRMNPAPVTSSEPCQGRSFVAKQTTAAILKCSDSESDDYLESECPKQDFFDGEDEEENSLEYGADDENILAQNEKKTKSDSQSKQNDSLKKEILMSFVSKSTDLYQRILNYEPLELDYLKKLLKEKEIKVTSHFLIDFLDEQNILFTTRNNRAVCNSRRLPAKGKVISRPAAPQNILSIG